MNKIHVAQLKPENQQQVQTFIEDILQRSKLPGISVAMDVNGQTLQAAAGTSDAQLNHPMNTDMHFELGCLNKFLTAIVVLELVNEEKIDLEQVISYYLPELEGKNGNKIKVKHLLSHSAGYQGENLADPDVQMDYSYGEFCQSFNQRPMLFEPGTLFDYSHSSSVILSRIVESLTKKNIEELMQMKIFNPLEIKVIKANHVNLSSSVCGHQLDLETAQLLRPFPIEWCDFWSSSLGGSWISMGELVKIGKILIDESSVISIQTRDFLLSSAMNLPNFIVAAKSEQPFFQFGLGCARFHNGSYGMRSNSQGQCCSLRFGRETGIVIAVGINADAAYLRDFTTEKLFNAMLPEDPAIISELLPPPETELYLESLVGTYQGAQHHSYIVSLEGERLVLKVGHNSSASQSTNENLLYLVRDEQGRVKFQNPELGFSIGFFRDLNSGRFNLMFKENCFVRC